ncbi:MAG: chemotaxis protein CheD [Chloroflexi bacterium]|nr:chemotaxis protein CheD [Chloroflexota bacterium]
MANRRLSDDKGRSEHLQDKNTIAVGLGEMVVTKDREHVLVAYGLGSCIGLAAYDPMGPVAGMLHAVLPMRRNGDDNLYKFVDTGIPALIDEMKRMGASMRRIRWYVAGGAHMLTAPGFKGMFDIGRRNVEMTQRLLTEYGIEPVAMAVRGSKGRTLKLYVASGRVTVRFAGGEEKVLSVAGKR